MFLKIRSEIDVVTFGWVYLKCYQKALLCYSILWQIHSFSSVLLVAIFSVLWNINCILSFKNPFQSSLFRQSSHSHQRPGLIYYDVILLNLKRWLFHKYSILLGKKLPSNLKVLSQSCAIINLWINFFFSMALMQNLTAGCYYKGSQADQLTSLFLCSPMYSMSICYLYLLLNL